MNNFLKKIGKGFIYGYQIIIRPIFPSSCRFHPSCSEYTLQSIEKYGLLQGSIMGLRQISQCHGFFQKIKKKE